MDVMINQSGDLVMESLPKAERFKLSFRLSQSPGLAVSFHMIDREPPQVSAPLVLSFKHTHELDHGERAATVSGRDETVQRIRIALLTERGSLPSMDDFGSMLSVSRHKELLNEGNLVKIEEYVREAIRNVIVPSSVIVRPEKGTGNFYAQTVGIYIYENEILLFNFQL